MTKESNHLLLLSIAGKLRRVKNEILNTYVFARVSIT